MVLIGVASYISHLKIYRSSAILLFQSNYIPVEDYFTLLDKLEDQPVQIVRSLLYGQPAKNIVHTVWPETDGNDAAINGKITHLRSKNGLEMRFQRDNPQALQIAYKNDNPKLAFEVVKATLTEINQFNKSVTQERLKVGMEFLNEELEKTREELSELERQIVRVRSGLPQEVIEKTSKQYDAFEKMLDMADVEGDNVEYDIEKNLSKALNFNESVNELEFALKIAEKELEQLQSDLQTKKYLTDAEELETVLNAGDDAEISSINQLIIEKKQKLSLIKSQGYLDAHPSIKATKNEIANLEDLKSKKLLVLRTSLSKENEELARLKLEKRQNQKIDEKHKEIQMLKDRIKATIAYQEKFKDKSISLDDKLKELSERKAKLVELENKKLVTQHSYAQMAKRLAVIKREGRIDQDKFGLAVKVVEEPEIPSDPMAYAGLPVLLLSLVVTLGILFSLAAVITIFDTKVYSSRELSEVLKVSVLGSVDRFVNQSQKKKKKDHYMLSLMFILAYSVLIWLYFDK